MKKLLLIPLVLLFLIPLANAEISTKNWLAGYSFNNVDISGSTLIDCAIGDSSNDDGIISFATSGVTGQIGQALDFEKSTNNNQVDFGTGTEFHVTPNLSMFMWVNIESIHTGQILSTQQDNNANGYRFGVNQGNLSVEVYPQSTTFTSNQSISTGEFIMVGFIQNDSGMHYYINGTLIDSDVGVDPWDAPEQNAFLGTTLGGDRFDGIMDEMVIFGRAWNDSDIEQYFNNGVGVSACTLAPFVPIPPVIIDTVLNKTDPDFFEIISFSVTVSDDTQLNSIFLADNRTGSFANFTSVSLPTGQTLLTHIFNISAVAGSNIQLQATVLDSEGSSAQSNLIIEAVTGNQIFGNETCDNLDNFSGGVTSEEGNCVIDAVGEFARYINELPGAAVERNTRNWSILLDIAVDLTGGADKRIVEFWLDNRTHTDDTNLSVQISILSNDSVQVVNVPDGTTSLIEGLTDNGLFNDVKILFLDKQMQIINASGSIRANVTLNENFTNITFINFGAEDLNSPNVRFDNFTVVNGTELISSVAQQILNIYTSSGDTIQPNITLIAPTNNTRNNTVPLNITFITSDDGIEDITCTLSNSTTTFDEITTPQNIESGLLLAKGIIALDQEFPNLLLTCFDNTPLNNSLSLVLNYTLDTVPPVIFPILPGNRSTFNTDIVSEIQIKANCTDAPVFKFNITIFNDSDQIASFEDLIIENNFLVIDEVLDISTLGLGNYTIQYICSDPHTENKIDNYNTRKNITNNKIRYTTSTKNTYEIIYPDVNTEVISNYGTNKHSDGSKYYFWYGTNETESKAIRTYTFEIQNQNKEVYYIQNSKYKGHFVTGNNWIDFEFGDPRATYLVTKNIDNNYEIEITTTKTFLNFTSTGELNTNTIETQFEIFFVFQAVDFLSKAICNKTIPGMIFLTLLFLMSFAIIVAGLHFKIGIIGFLGSLLLLVLSWFVAPCIAIFGFILGALGIVLMAMFVTTGLQIPVKRDAV